MTTLTELPVIMTALFVKITVPDYETLTFSNADRDFTLGTDVYTGLGQLLAVTDTTSEIRVSQSTVTITVSGLQTKNITDFTQQRIKGSRVQVLRGIFSQTTSELLELDISNPCGRFSGLVNNYSITESWDNTDSSVQISMTCNSLIDQLQRKVSGRRTNPQEFQATAPGDVSMDRVPTIQRAQLQFGGD